MSPLGILLLQIDRIRYSLVPLHEEVTHAPELFIEPKVSIHTLLSLVKQNWINWIKIMKCNKLLICTFKKA